MILIFPVGVRTTGQSSCDRVHRKDRGGRRRLSEDSLHIPGILPQNDGRSEEMESAVCGSAWRLQRADRIWLTIYRRKGQYVRYVPGYRCTADLVSFAVDIAKTGDMITPELKTAGNKLVWLRIEKDSYSLPVYAQVMDQYGKFHEDIQNGNIVSAYALDRHGMAAAVSKMAFGNGMGVKIEHNLDPREFFAPGFGDLIAEVPADKVGNLPLRIP